MNTNTRDTPQPDSATRPDCAPPTGSPPFFSLRLDELKAKIERGDRLTNDERAERQGIIFNHSGKARGFQVI
ncbi:MAG: hypothetical protein KIT44_07985 [Opitutaceae bacterium]|nr:hypothetical protein [Opitutaceae bacterium]